MAGMTAWCAIFAAVLAAIASVSCAPTEETTPHGYVIAPSVPADAGVVATALDGG
jgi:hypothetical protein